MPLNIYKARHAPYIDKGTEAVPYPDDMADLISLSIAERVKDKIEKVYLGGTAVQWTSGRKSRHEKTADIVAQSLNIEFDKNKNVEYGYGDKDCIVICSESEVDGVSDKNPPGVIKHLREGEGRFHCVRDMPEWGLYEMYKCVADGMDWDAHSQTIDYILEGGKFGDPNDSKGFERVEPKNEEEEKDIYFKVLSPYSISRISRVYYHFKRDFFNILLIHLLNKEQLLEKDIILRDKLSAWFAGARKKPLLGREHQ